MLLNAVKMLRMLAPFDFCDLDENDDREETGAYQSQSSKGCIVGIWKAVDLGVKTVSATYVIIHFYRM